MLSTVRAQDGPLDCVGEGATVWPFQVSAVQVAIFLGNGPQTGVQDADTTQVTDI